MMYPLRRLAPALLALLLAAGLAQASEHCRHIALLASGYGDAIYDRREETPFFDQETHLVRDRRGKLNIAEVSLNYAAALLVTGEQTQRALQVIEAALAHQDIADGSPTRGMFRWTVEPDAEYDANATLYLAPTLAYLARTVEEPELRARLQESARLALQALLTAGERPAEGFGQAMWAGAVCSLGDAVGDEAGTRASAGAVEALLARLRSRGFSNVHSPTFDALRIGGLRWAWQYAADDAAREQADLALRICYADMLQRYDAATAMVAGAIGSAYAAEYLGKTGVAQYLLACDLPSALAATCEVGPLAMYFALSDYAPPAEMLAAADADGPAREVRTRKPDPEEQAPEAYSTSTWTAPGISLGTMSGIVDTSSIPILATCDLIERPTSYFYVFGGPAMLYSAQSGSLALCSFNFDAVGMGQRMVVGVRGMLGRRDHIDRVLVGSHEWIGEPEAVGQQGVVAVRRGSSYLGVKILEVGTGAELSSEVKPGVIRWYAEGNMDSLMLEVYGRRRSYRLPKPLYDVRVGLLVEVAPASSFAGLAEFADHVSRRRVAQDTEAQRVRVDPEQQRQIPGRHEIKTVAEMQWVRLLYHSMSLVDPELALGLREELLRNRLESRTLPMELPANYLWVSPGLTLLAGGEPSFEAEGAGQEQPPDA